MDIVGRSLGCSEASCHDSVHVRAASVVQSWVDTGQLFAPVESAASPSTITGRRSINRVGDGELIARSREEFGDLVRHSGEEFILVIEGQVEVHTELYAPLVLSKGESAYIDSTMGHAYIAKGDGPCRIVGVCSASESDLREVAGKSLPREPAARRKATPAKSRKPTRHR
jgi:hypothetical protein